MLKECHPVRQVPGERPRRWFASETLELIAWFEPDGSPAAFQLCYPDGQAERAVSARRGGPLAYFEVDPGESRPMSHKATPTLDPAPAHDLGDLVDRFRAESAGLDPALRRMILDSLGAPD